MIHTLPVIPHDRFVLLISRLPIRHVKTST
jgi:hypothetical protein